MLVEFMSSKRSTVGVEVEYGIVSRDTGELMPVASEILNEIIEGGDHPKAKNELFQPSLEVITGICETPAEAIADLAGTLRELKPVLDARGLGLVSTGTHPFADWSVIPVTPSDRYLRLVERVQWPALRLMIHGVHVHVGVRSPDKAIITTNVLAMYLPILLALSASSPYWKGRDTGLASARTKIFEGLPTTGIPPQLGSWEEYNTLLTALVTAGTVETVREIWWDIRPHPDFGTVELRMCDGITSLQEVATVAAIAQALVTYIDEQIDAGGEFALLPDWVLKENKWRACRYGIEADLITDEHGKTAPLRQLLAEMVTLLEPVAQRLGGADELRYALTIAEHGASSDRQRQLVADGATLVELVEMLADETDQSVAATE